MSILVKNAFDVKTGSYAKKVVLVFLASKASIDGRCSVSFAEIAEFCELDKRTVIRLVQNLVDLGMLEKHQPAGHPLNSFELIFVHGASNE